MVEAPVIQEIDTLQAFSGCQAFVGAVNELLALDIGERRQPGNQSAIESAGWSLGRACELEMDLDSFWSYELIDAARAAAAKGTALAETTGSDATRWTEFFNAVQELRRRRFRKVIFSKWATQYADAYEKLCKGLCDRMDVLTSGYEEAVVHHHRDPEEVAREHFAQTKAPAQN